MCVCVCVKAHVKAYITQAIISLAPISGNWVHIFPWPANVCSHINTPVVL